MAVAVAVAVAVAAVAVAAVAVAAVAAADSVLQSKFGQTRTRRPRESAALCTLLAQSRANP